jgi:hypothetical protein
MGRKSGVNFLNLASAPKVAMRLYLAARLPSRRWRPILEISAVPAKLDILTTRYFWQPNGVQPES